MRQSLFFYLVILLAFTHTLEIHATDTEAKTCTPPADEVRISLLTCAAGEDIYTLFGHTAIRYESPSQGIDVVFNYGMFSFNTPNFALRFALGETDYQLGLTDYRRFAAEYLFDEREVWQQTLNLTPLEKERLWQALKENYLPQNRIYRYNFFHDNCATRPRDQIEACIEGKIQYATQSDSLSETLTWRQLLHRYTEGHPWSRFGIDLCIGSPADQPINFRERMFIPFYVQRYFREAQIVNHSGTSRPLVSEEKKVISTDSLQHNTSAGITPLQLMSILLALVAAASFYGWNHKRSLWMLDATLFTAAGIAGCILAFLVLFSQHPAIRPNWILLVLHPLHLCCLPWALRRIKKRQISRYMLANALVLTLFILLWSIIPQNIPLAVLPLALCLLIRSVSNLILQESRPILQEKERDTTNKQ